MASSYSTNLRLELMADGEKDDAWGGVANSVFEMLEEAAGGVVSVALTTTSETLTTNNNAADQSRPKVCKFSGSPGGTCTVTVPDVEHMRLYVNGSDQSVIIDTTGGGATVTIAAGDTALVYTDGSTNAYDAGFQLQDANLTTYLASPLSAAELGELQNIDSVTITNTQWGYLGAADQGFATTSSPTFANVDLSTGGALRAGQTATNTLKIQAYDVDGAAFADVITVTSANTPTLDLLSTVTIGSLTPAIDDGLVYRRASTTSSGPTAASGSWTDFDEFNTTDLNEISGVTFTSTNVVDLPAGTYECEYGVQFYRVEWANVRLYNVTAASVLDTGEGLYTYNGQGNHSGCFCRGFHKFTIGSTSTVKIQYYCESGYTDGLGEQTAPITRDIGYIRLRKVG